MPPTSCLALPDFSCTFSLSLTLLTSCHLSFSLYIYIYSLPIAEHLGLALALNVPVFVVVTKVDICPENVLDDTMTLLQKILKSPGCRKMPLIVSNVDDVIVTASNFVSER